MKKTRLFAESWNVAFRKKQAGSILTDDETQFCVIPNSRRYWAADPFVLEQNGEAYIFAELYDYVLRRGILGYCKIMEGKPSAWRPVITETYHLSYPCIVKREGKLFLMPESGAGNELALYEAVEFPYRWHKSKVLRSNVRFADTTPIPVGGARLALTHQVDDPQNPQLMLIDLDGQKNDIPITNSVPLRSRPAGQFLWVDGELIRPAQYSENPDDGYGKGLIFYRCQLGESGTYIETEIKEIRPENLKYDKPIFLDGMHTYNTSEHYEVIDIKTRRFNLLNLLMRAVGKFLR